MVLYHGTESVSESEGGFPLEWHWICLMDRKDWKILTAVKVQRRLAARSYCIIRIHLDKIARYSTSNCNCH
jgi:hypothetical protein